MLPNSVTPRSSKSPTWSETITSSFHQLYAYATSAGANAQPHIDGSGNEKAPTARSVRRRQEQIVAKYEKEKARQPAKKTEPVLTTLARTVASWMPSLPGMTGVDGALIKPAGLPDPETARFIRETSEDFTVEDFGRGTLLAGRPVVFLTADQADEDEYMMQVQALRSLRLEAGDLLLVQARQALSQGQLVQCYGLYDLGICNSYVEPPETNAVSEGGEEMRSAAQDLLDWLKPLGVSTTPLGADFNFAQILKVLTTGVEQLKLRIVRDALSGTTPQRHAEQAKLADEADKRLSEIVVRGREFQALALKGKMSRPSRILNEMKEALKPDSRFATVFNKEVGNALRAELIALKALIVEVKPGRVHRSAGMTEKHQDL